jgi:hypothetical protein
MRRIQNRTESVVRTIGRPLVVLAAVAFILAHSPFLMADRIEAVKGKHYKLTKRHGPWMIMVASFLTPPEDRRSAGMTPEQAAEELVYELRLKGIPAYAFQLEEPTEEEMKIKTVSRRTAEDREGKLRWLGGICVLAGNYPSANDPRAKRTLKYIKEKFDPQFLRDVAASGALRDSGDLIQVSKSGGVFRTTPNRPRPLSGAFLTTNPVLTDSELAAKTRDPLIIQLNSGSEYSLLHNPGTYTVVVATFQGKAQAHLGDAPDAGKLQISGLLDDAMNRAWELCTALRRARSLGYDEDIEAYVYHDRYSSIVTVGSFKSKTDPRIVEIQNKFGAKVAGVNDGKPLIGAEAFVVPKKPLHRDEMKTWIFDPYPQLIEVPKTGADTRQAGR